jgi:glutamine amidotransferase
MGICLGMQVMFEQSEEFGASSGLGLVKGKVVRFSNQGPQGPVRVPQIGWNRIFPPDGDGQIAGPATAWEATPLRGIDVGEFMYFVHSYYAMPSDAADALAVADYEGTRYCAAIRRGNIFAAQFHPEKSATHGLHIYRNWAQEIQRNADRSRQERV